MEARPDRARPWLIAAVVGAFVLMGVAIVVVVVGAPGRADRPGVASAASSPTASPEPAADGTVVVDPASVDVPTDAELALIEDLIEFAHAPDPRVLERIPLSVEGTWLGLADELRVFRTRDELADPSAWWLASAAFRARVGPFSALDLLSTRDLVPEAPAAPQVSARIGEHPHCASPPVRPPAGFEAHRRLSVQPLGISSCVQWWTVDLFIDEGGVVEAITLDMYEP